MYKYVKAPPGYTLKRKVKPTVVLRKTFSAILLTLGISAFTSVAYPLIYYQIALAPRLVIGELTPSVAGDKTDSIEPEREKSEPAFFPEMINTTLDYTDSTTWFPTPQTTKTPSLGYQLSIPSLGIENASVEDTHTDLKRSLIHYPGTASPGDLGNTVIFGHSVLPQFFNPESYITIFSTLHTLSKGDEIKVYSDGAEFTYTITDMYEVMPDNLTPLAQSYSARNLTLITCTPPGTYLRRLIVKAELR